MDKTHRNSAHGQDPQRLPVLPSPLPEEAPVPATSPAATVAWDDVAGLDPQLRHQLKNIHTRGVFWNDPRNPSSVGLRFRLSHGGAVDSNGNCLFSAVRITMGSEIGHLELRQRTVQRFLQVQPHGSYSIADEEVSVFFLPYQPRSEVVDPPRFLFMKGKDWCLAGADHYEPLIATPMFVVSPEMAAVKL